MHDVDLAIVFDRKSGGKLGKKKPSSWQKMPMEMQEKMGRNLFRQSRLPQQLLAPRVASRRFWHADKLS